VVIFTPRPLYPQGNSPWYPWDKRMDVMMMMMMIIIIIIIIAEFILLLSSSRSSFVLEASTTEFNIRLIDHDP
jgi:hypothetical protein